VKELEGFLQRDERFCVSSR